MKKMGQREISSSLPQLHRGLVTVVLRCCVLAVLCLVLIFVLILILIFACSVFVRTVRCVVLAVLVILAVLAVLAVACCVLARRVLRVIRVRAFVISCHVRFLLRNKFRIAISYNHSIPKSQKNILEFLLQFL